ncbi:MAG: nucleoside triphosphate pyrophosphatase [Lautropia sp.]
MRLILASTSPYRRTLLSRLMLDFDVEDPAADETPAPGEAPLALARRLALAKAQSVAGRRAGCVVIGSDQVATLDQRTPIGKPGNADRARRQLLDASGRTMWFHTAFAVVAPGREPIVESVPVEVRFRPLDPAHVDRYLALEAPFDCAGSAKSEGLGVALLEEIRTTDQTALVGLPLIRLAAALRAVGIDPLAPAPTQAVPSDAAPADAR